jgi:hypothetical protein
MQKYCRTGQATNDNIVRRMRFARWVHKAKDTHSETVIYIAFPLQHRLHERASVLHYTRTYIGSALLTG